MLCFTHTNYVMQSLFCKQHTTPKVFKRRKLTFWSHFLWNARILCEKHPSPRQRTKRTYCKHLLKPCSLEVLPVFDVSANMSSHQVADSTYIKGFGMSTMALSCSPSEPPAILQTFFAQFRAIPPNSVPLLSCYPAPTPFSSCRRPDCWIGAKRSDSQRGQS